MKKLRFQIKKTLILLLVVINLLPFFIHEVNAETITSHVVGSNVWTDRIDYIVVDSSANQFRNYCNVHVEIVLDNEYVGWQNLGLAVYYYSVNFSNNTWTRYNRQVSGNYYINGNSLEIIVPISFDSIAQPYYQAYNGTGQTLPQSDSSINLSFTTQGNVISYGELATLEDILSVLTDIYNNVSIDLYGELQNIIQKLGISNQYLETISKMRQWNIPIESFSFVNMFFNKNIQPNYFANYNYFNFPVFPVVGGTDKFYLYFSKNLPYTMVFGLSDNLYNIAQIENYIGFSSSDISFTSYQRVGQFNYGSNERICWILKVEITNTGNEGQYYMEFLRNADVIPIYFNRSDYKYIGTEFALQFGLSNSLLDNVQIIANGTNQSNQSSSNLQGENNDLQNTQTQLFQYEDDFNNDMNTVLQSINTNFDIGTSFNSKFLLAADWVRTQFNLLTNQNPFGTLLSFSLLLGVALLIIGKVLG